MSSTKRPRTPDPPRLRPPPVTDESTPIRDADSTRPIAESRIPPTKAIHVEAKLRKELSSGIYIDTDKFIEKVTESKELDAYVEPIFKACCAGDDEPYYDVNKEHWSNFGPSKKSQPEKSYYTRIADLTNRITSQCPEHIQPDREVHWRDDHATSAPTSDIDHAVNVKPDMSANIGEFLPVAHWGRFMVPIEVKKEGAPEAAVFQLTKYIRQVFNENYDRRFVLGIVMCDTRFALYLADRSGIIGSKTHDINKDPRLFVRLVAAIKMLPLERLGWDTTMGMIKIEHSKVVSEHCFSYLVDRDEWDDYRYTMRMPKPDPEDPTKMLPGEWETFVLLVALSIFRGEVIVGRATRLWKACRLRDMGIPVEERQIFIIKDSWRDKDRDVEGELYRIIHQWEQANAHPNVKGRGLAKMYSFGTVLINGEKDTTAFIRRSMKVQGSPRQLDRQQPEYCLPAKRHDTNYIPIDIDYLPSLEGEAKAPQILEHQRLVIATYGWTLKSFVSCAELVRVLEDVVVGLRNSYDAGVLHRDVSVGNILILPKPKKGHHGVLIDLDNAILPESHKPIPHDPLTGTLPFVSGELLLKTYYFEPQQEQDAKPNTVTVQEAYGARVSHSRGDGKTRTREESDDEDMLEDYHDAWRNPLPDAKLSNSDENAKSKLQQLARSVVPKHEPIHDHEALFWSLVWLGMRTGAPCHRREELKSKSAETKRLRDTFFYLFDHSPATVGYAKSQIMQLPEKLETTIIPFITPFCAPMISLIRSWHSILHKAYRSHEYGDISNDFWDAARDARKEMAKPESLPPDWIIRHNAEQERRRLDEANLSWGTDLSTPSKVHRTPPAAEKGSSTSQAVDHDQGSPTLRVKRARHGRASSSHPMKKRSSSAISLKAVQQPTPDSDEEDDAEVDPPSRGREQRNSRSKPQGKNKKGKNRKGKGKGKGRVQSIVRGEVADWGM